MSRALIFLFSIFSFRVGLPEVLRIASRRHAHFFHCGFLFFPHPGGPNFTTAGRPVKAFRREPACECPPRVPPILVFPLFHCVFPPILLSSLRVFFLSARVVSSKSDVCAPVMIPTQPSRSVSVQFRRFVPRLPHNLPVSSGALCVSPPHSHLRLVVEKHRTKHVNNKLPKTNTIKT